MISSDFKNHLRKHINQKYVKESSNDIEESSYPIINSSHSPSFKKSSSHSTGHLLSNNKVVEVNRMIEDLRNLLPFN